MRSDIQFCSSDPSRESRPCTFIVVAVIFVYLTHLYVCDRDGYSIGMILSCLRIDAAAAVLSQLSFVRPDGTVGRRAPGGPSVRPSRAAASDGSSASSSSGESFSRPRGTCTRASERASSVHHVTVLHPWREGEMPRAFKETVRRREARKGERHG